MFDIDLKLSILCSNFMCCKPCQWPLSGSLALEAAFGLQQLIELRNPENMFWFAFAQIELTHLTESISAMHLYNINSLFSKEMPIKSIYGHRFFLAYMFSYHHLWRHSAKHIKDTELPLSRHPVVLLRLDNHCWTKRSCEGVKGHSIRHIDLFFRSRELRGTTVSKLLHV